MLALTCSRPRLDNRSRKMSSSSISKAVSAVALGLLLLAPITQAQDSTPNGETFPNIAANCNAYHTVVDQDNCATIVQTYGITLSQFHEWNPDVSDDCATNFWLGYAYCVGVGPALPSSLIYSPVPCDCTASTTTSTTTSETAVTDTSSVVTSSSVSSNTEPYSTLNPITNYTVTPTTVVDEFPPTRTQAGQATDCIDWYLTTAFDTCDSIVASNSWLTLEKL